MSTSKPYNCQLVSQRVIIHIAHLPAVAGIGEATRQYTDYGCSQEDTCPQRRNSDCVLQRLDSGRCS